MLSTDEKRLLRSLPGPLIAAEKQGTILWVNKPSCILLDYDEPEELIGRPLTTIMPERLVARHQEGFRRYLETGRSRLLGHRIRVIALTRTGDEQAIELCIRMFRREDGTDLIIAAMGIADSAENHIEFSVTRLEDELSRRHYEPA